ncbi:MAG: DNA cytosine methyltransferase [Hyphomicrobiaceae bacterium]
MAGRARKQKYQAASLFAGCGGLDLGFRGGFTSLRNRYAENAFEFTFANDIEPHATLTYANNISPDIVTGDILEILKSNALPARADIVLGGFPCQDFSHAGKRLGFDAARGNLYKAMGDTIKRLRPSLFMAENVKGLLTLDEGAAIATITRDFEHLGYHVRYRLYNTAGFGVPQRRERVVIIGTRKDVLPPFEMPEPHLDESEWVTLRAAIGDLADQPESSVPNHIWSRARRNTGQGNTTVDPDRPGPTMRAEHHGNIEYHWSAPRRLSAREAARIQSFPDDFIFYPSTSAAYRQIGNAVPPVFAWHIARAIQRFLDRHLSRV